jgi:hypothetical protein
MYVIDQQYNLEVALHHWELWVSAKTPLTSDANRHTVPGHSRAGFRPRGLKLRTYPRLLTGKGAKLIGVKIAWCPDFETQLVTNNRLHDHFFAMFSG